MIFVDRNRLDDGGKPIRPSADWEQRAAERTRIARDEGSGHQVSDLYSDGEVKKALEELFHRKCAYCEQRLGEEWDVEHYRPKGGVAESPGHPGYYWLAYTWTNLYASCKHCNQQRKDAALWRDPRALPAAGKLDQFPLADESKRAADHFGAIDAEQPLLLDPCRSVDEVERRFIFDPQGEIKAASAPDGIHLFAVDSQGSLYGPDTTDLRAEATIGICNLNRRRLKEDRAKIMATVSDILNVLETALTTGAEAALVNQLRALIARLTRDDAYFAGAARFVIRDPVAFIR